VTRFEDFKRDCLSNGEVICDWDTLHEYLVGHTVADNWWVLTREQRYNIAKAIHRDIPLYTKYRYGLKKCEGGTTEEYPVACHDAAQYMYMRLNGEIRGDNLSAVYYTNPASPDWEDEYCLGTESYKLPVYYVSVKIYRTPHAINAILIDQDYTNVNNWVFFEAPKTCFDLKPPHRMSGGDPCNAARIYKDYHCEEKPSDDYVFQILRADSEYIMFPIDINNNFREPGKRTIHIETEPAGLKAIIDDTIKFERKEKITPCNIEVSMGVVGVAIRDPNYPHFTISGELHVGEEYLRLKSPYCKSITNTGRGIMCEYNYDKYGYYPVTLSMEVVDRDFHDTSPTPTPAQKKVTFDAKKGDGAILSGVEVWIDGEKKGTT